MRFRKLWFGLLLLWFSAAASATQLKYSLHKLESGVSGPTLLIIGGIQGNEPGGFTAASLLVTDYEITRGQVWVIPNTNFPSIVARSRGVHGDLNRKFSVLDNDDPEFELIQRIKAIITEPEVDVVLNLHDGSGFYFPTYESKMRNPNRWGNCLVIDQEQIGDTSWTRLGEFARRVIEDVNLRIQEPSHHYHVKNTKTRLGDREMEKTLTYFAIQKNVPAFGVEASKSFGTARRTWFHLTVMESFMRDMGITFKRSFPLTVADVKEHINQNIRLTLYDKQIFLDVANARRWLNFLPLKKDAPLQYRGSNPLIALVNERGVYGVRYGNRNLTLLRPEYFEFDDSLQQVSMTVDGSVREVEIGSMVDVAENLRIESIPGYRVNVIGFRKQGLRSETGVTITREEIARRFSIDRDGRIFRVEFYRGKKFSGMVLVNFPQHPAAARQTAQALSTRDEG